MSGSDIAPFLPWIFGALSFAALLGSLRANRRRRLVDDMPTSKTTGVFIGLVELKGTAENEQPLTSFLAAIPCVHFAWRVEEHWSRTVTESYTDAQGRSQTRTRHESGWATVTSGGAEVKFYLQDDCGAVLIQPTGATIEARSVFNETCSPITPLYYAKGPAHAVANSDHRRRFSEEAIPLHAPVFVVGRARERSDVVAAEIAADPAAPMFLISTRSEKEISAGFGWGIGGWGIFGLLLALGAGAIVAEGELLNVAPENRWVCYLTPALVYFAAAALGWVWMVYNSVVSLRNRVRQGWSQVEVQLKRRHDLIPALVSVVTGLRDHESTVQTELAALRAQMTATPPGVAGPDYQACTRTAVILAERYPELTAQDSFLNLQQNLVDTEQRIALARGYFNEIATYYNTRLEVVPDRFVAALAGLRPEPLMAANDFERAPVAVRFQA